MMMNRRHRRGTTLVETALIYPIIFMIVLGIILLGMSVFRYQQMSHIAREASRWASVRAAVYAKENNTTAASQQDIYNNAIVPHLGGINPQQVTYSVVWNTKADGTEDKDQTRTVSSVDPATGLTQYKQVSNTVSVTVTYQWDTKMFGIIQVSSTSTNIISY